MKLVIGLGNPGKQYERTRHNSGFLALDLMAKSLDVWWKADAKHKCKSTKSFVDEERVVLAKPTTFMNLSGDAVQSLLTFYKADIKDVLIVQDDLDLLPGQMRFISQGGAAGHNGITSIFEKLGRKDISRLRIGIGHPTGEIKVEDWVLGKLNDETVKRIEDAPDAILDWINLGLEKSMTKWNGK